MTQEFEIRSANPGDIAFIYDTWKNSFRYDKVTPGIRNFIYYPEQTAVMDAILNDDRTKVSVVCKKDESFVVFGYMVYQPKPAILHYIYIKEPFQKLGLAKALFAQGFGPEVGKTENLQCSHKTKKVSDLFSTNDRLIYNPYLICSTHLKGEDNG